MGAPRIPVRFLRTRFPDDHAVPAGGQPDAHDGEIKEELSGNLCRCTGYATILEGVAEAVAKLASTAGGATMREQTIAAIRRRPRPEGRGPPPAERARSLRRRCRRPGHAARGIRPEPMAARPDPRYRHLRAAAVPGVYAIFTGPDIAAITNPLMGMLALPGLYDPWHCALAIDRVRLVGDPVAIVVATSRAVAEDAAELIDVDYEELDRSPRWRTPTIPAGPRSGRRPRATSSTRQPSPSATSMPRSPGPIG